MKAQWIIPLTTALTILLGAAPVPAGRNSASTTPAGPGVDPNVSTRAAEQNRQVVALKTEELALVNKMLETFPNAESVLVMAGNVYKQHGDVETAMKYWNRALEINSNRTDVYAGFGTIAMGKGRYNEAIQHWRKALQIDPNAPGLHTQISLALMGQGNHAEAIEELKTAVKRTPNPAREHFLLGQEYAQLKQYALAKPHYETAIQLEPYLTNAYYGLSTVCSRLEQKDEASKHLAKFKELKAQEMKILKDRDEAYNDLENTRQNAAQTHMDAAMIYRQARKIPEAAALLEKTLQLDDRYVRAINELAFIYQATDRPADALKLYKKQCEIEPTNPIAFLNRGVQEARLRNFAAAEEAFRKVVEMAPANSEGYRELARLYLGSGRNAAAALKMAEKAVQIDPIAANYYVLSWAHDRNGQRAQALTALKRAVDLAPGNAQYRRAYQMMLKRK